MRRQGDNGEHGDKVLSAIGRLSSEAQSRIDVAVVKGVGHHMHCDVGPFIAERCISWLEGQPIETDKLPHPVMYVRQHKL